MQSSKVNFLEYIDIIDDFDEDQSCLITREKLEENHVSLKCGHKFNYVPLFLDIFKQKIKLNAKRIKFYCCPYCRIENKEILPYYCNSQINLIPIFNVNTIDESYKVESLGGNLSYYKKKSTEKCCTLNKNKTNCNHKGLTRYNVLDKNYYCLKHFNQYYKKYFNSLNLEPIIIKENKVIQAEKERCKVLLKSGKNKGNECGALLKKGMNTCKRHESKS